MSSSRGGLEAEDRLPQQIPPAAHDEVAKPLGQSPFWLAVGGLAAGLIAFGVGEMIYGLIPTARERVVVMGHPMLVPTFQTQTVAATRNGALSFGVLGGCLGGFLGIAGGLTRRSLRELVTASVSGAVLGSGLPAVASFGLLPFFLQFQPDHADYELVLSLLMHLAVWGPIGAIAGVAFAIGLGERNLIARAGLGGFVGAALGAAVFELIGAGLFPFAHTGQPISTTWQTRLMARLCVALGTAAFVFLFLRHARAGKTVPSAIAPAIES